MAKVDGIAGISGRDLLCDTLQKTLGQAQSNSDSKSRGCTELADAICVFLYALWQATRSRSLRPSSHSRSFSDDDSEYRISARAMTGTTVTTEEATRTGARRRNHCYSPQWEF